LWWATGMEELYFLVSWRKEAKGRNRRSQVNKVPKM